MKTQQQKDVELYNYIMNPSRIWTHLWYKYYAPTANKNNNLIKKLKQCGQVHTTKSVLSNMANSLNTIFK